MITYVKFCLIHKGRIKVKRKFQKKNLYVKQKNFPFNFIKYYFHMKQKKWYCSTHHTNNHNNKIDNAPLFLYKGTTTQKPILSKRKQK